MIEIQENNDLIKYDSINNYYKKKPIHKLICAKHWLHHDGYDRYGPKSNLYEIVIAHVSTNSDNVIVDHWHAEYWFREDNVSFDIASKIYTSQEFSNYYKKSLKNSDETVVSFMDHIEDFIIVGNTYFTRAW